MVVHDHFRIVMSVWALVMLVLLEVGDAWNHHPPMTRQSPFQVACRGTPSSRTTVCHTVKIHPTTSSTRTLVGLRRNLINYHDNHVRSVSIPSRVIRQLTFQDRQSEEQPDNEKDMILQDSSQQQEPESHNNDPWYQRIRTYFRLGQNNKQDDGLTFRQRLANMGVATVLSYGMVSNISYAILMAVSWYTFSAKVSTVIVYMHVTCSS